MIAQNVLIALVGLAANVQASPCKPSSVTTETGTAVTDTPSTSSSDVTYTIVTPTSAGSTTDTTETAPATTTETGPELTYSCPGGFPSRSSCGIRYNHDHSNGRIIGTAGAGSAAASSLDVCLQACADNTACDFFAFWPGQLCELWAGDYSFDSSGNMGASSWYEISCFCVPGREETTPSAVTTTIATTTEATTTETTTAEATTTAASPDACTIEKGTFPVDKVCNKKGIYDGTAMTFLDAPLNVKTVESCRKACRDNNNCTYFAITPGQSCWIYGGTLDKVRDQQTDYAWYDMDCFCDMEEKPTPTTIDGTTTGVLTDTATETYTAPVNK